MNKVFYDILFKLNVSNSDIEINRKLVLKYFSEFNDKNVDKYNYFKEYFINFYNFCFDKDLENMVKETLKFRT